MHIEWTDYIKHRATLRGFDLAQIEQIVRHATERYFDSATRRIVVVGRHNTELVLVPCDREGDSIIPVTVHATSRRQINARLQTGKFQYE